MFVQNPSQSDENEPNHLPKRSIYMHDHDLIHQTDGGPIYFESDFNSLIVEPFNMVSAAIFVPLAIYWFYVNEKQENSSLFLRLASILLFIGGVGGTIYHGFRVSTFALFLDWAPILILCIGAAGYFLFKSFKKKRIVAYASLMVAAALLLNLAFTPVKHYDNVAYLVLSIYVLAPTVIVLYRRNWKNLSDILLSLIFFSIALSCRVLDREGILSIGTHFLWHVFGAMSTFFIFRFVFHLESVPKKLISSQNSAAS